MAPDSGGELVGSGSFRVDRAKALEKLQRYRFADPSQFVLSLVRCAVLGGASRVLVRGLAPKAGWLRRHDGIEVLFDGRPFSPAELADPYAPYFDEDAARDRRRVELGRAVLTLEGTRPRELTLAPGLVRAVWDGPSRATGTVAEWLLSRCGCCPIPVEFQDLWQYTGDSRRREGGRMVLSAAGSRLGSLDFSSGGFRGRLEVPDHPAISACRLELAQAGVLAETLREAWPGVIPVDGFIDGADFSLSLSLSQAAVVRDESFARALERLALESGRLVQRAAAVQRGRLRETAGLLAGARHRAFWRGVLEGDVFDPGARSPEQRRRLYEDAARTRWLRSAVVACSEAPGRLPPEVKAALWEAPLLFSGKLEPLSLKDVERLAQAKGVVECGRGGPPQEPSGALWLSSSRDTAFLPAALKAKLSGWAGA